MKYLILVFAVMVLVSCESGKDDDMNENREKTGPIAYFPLDSSYMDESGNGILLQAFGNPEFTEGHGKEPFTAVLLDGEDDYLVATVGNLDTFSISMWILSYRYFVGEWPHWRSTVFDYANKQVYGYIDAVSGATQFSFGIAGEPVTGIVPDNMNNWFHLYVAVGKEVSIYYDGSLTATEPVEEPGIYVNGLLYLGRSNEDDEIKLTQFYGLLDEIRIYNRILDQSEIDELSSGK